MMQIPSPNCVVLNWHYCEIEGGFLMRLAITQYRSAIGRKRSQKQTVEALGLKRLHDRVVHEDSPQIRGMIAKVSHLVSVQEVD